VAETQRFMFKQIPRPEDTRDTIIKLVEKKKHEMHQGGV